MADLTPAQQQFIDRLKGEPFGTAPVGNGRALRLNTARALLRKGLIVLRAYPSTTTGRLTYDYQAVLVEVAK